MAHFFESSRKGSRRSSIRGAIGLSFVLYAAILPGPALAQPSQYDWGSVIAGCEACHGAGGDSRSANIPRLNGQRIDYMLGRLDVLGDPLQSETEHSNDPMWHIVSDMGTNIREDIVKYFAAQTPMVARPGVLAAQGQQLYEHGAPARVCWPAICATALPVKVGIWHRGLLGNIVVISRRKFWNLIPLLVLTAP